MSDVPQIDLDALADKVAARLKVPAVQSDYELIDFTFVGNELRATVKTPSGETYQGAVSKWEKVKVVEVAK